MLPWSDLFQPAIRLAEEGVVVGTELAGVANALENVIRADQSLRYSLLLYSGIFLSVMMNIFALSVAKRSLVYDEKNPGSSLFFRPDIF